MNVPLKISIVILISMLLGNVCSTWASPPVQTGKQATPDPYFDPAAVKSDQTTSPPSVKRDANKPAAARWEPPRTGVQNSNTLRPKTAVVGRAIRTGSPAAKSIIRENATSQPLQPQPNRLKPLDRPAPSQIAEKSESKTAPKSAPGPGSFEMVPSQVVSNPFPGSSQPNDFMATDHPVATDEFTAANDFMAVANDHLKAASQDTSAKTGAGIATKVGPTKNAFSPAKNPEMQMAQQKSRPVDQPTSPTPPGEQRGDQVRAVSFSQSNASPQETVRQIEVQQSGYATFEPTRLLAMVGDEPIFVADLMFEANQLVEKFMAGAPPSIRERERQNLIKRLLPKFVDQKVLYVDVKRSLPEGADIGLAIEQAAKEFDKSALPDMLENGGFASAADFDADLRLQGYSLRQLRDYWSKDQLTKYFLSQKLNIDTEVTHQQLLDEYRATLSEYAIPAKARWEQIMIRFDKAGSRENAENMIVELGNEIVYGANFAAVAKRSSHGFRASDGGQHDWTTKNALAAKELDEAIFTLPVGELSDKIETRDGFHIVRVLERTDATRTPFLEAQVEIKHRLLEQKRNAAFEEHLKKLRDEIPIEYFNLNGQVEEPTSISK